MKFVDRLLGTSILVIACFHHPHAQDVFSFHPVFSESDVLLLPEIEGSWETNEVSHDTITLQKTGDNFYEVQLKTKGGYSRYEGVFTRVGDFPLLDLLPILPKDIGGPDYNRHLMQVHSCIRIRLDGDTLRLGLLKYRWFYDNLIAKKTDLIYLLADSRIILTLPTNELRTFLAEHAIESGFLEDDLVFRRITPQQPSVEGGNRFPVTGYQEPEVQAAPVLTEQSCSPSFPYKDGWLGGDGGLSIPMGAKKTLWLFGDTFVGKKKQITRAASTMVGSTIGVSTCRSDMTIDMQYYWSDMYSDHPEPFFKSHTDRYRFWPTDGFMHNNNLYVVMSKIGPKSGASPDDIFNWTALGTTIARVANPEAIPPDQWKVDLTPWSNLIDANSYEGGLAEDGKYVYFFMLREHGKNYLLRLPLDYMESPNGRMEYFSADETWKPGSDSADAKILFDDHLIGRVVYHRESKRWLMVYGPHFGGKSIYFRSAPKITGPWSDRQVLYDCPEVTEGMPQYDQDNYCYCSRVLTQFFDMDSKTLRFIYSCNSKKQSKLIENMMIYAPRVVSIPVPR